MSYHPTLLVGFGEYGHALVVRYLADAAGRGHLRWRDDEHHPTGRRLRDLAPMWVPDKGAHGTPHDALQGSGVDILRDLDLLEQVDKVEPLGVIDDLSKAVVAAGERLLDASYESSVGLDIICLAAPRTNDAIGRLERLLAPAVHALASKQALQSPGEGLDLLNVLLLLDIENYWGGEPEARAMRTALTGFIGRQIDLRRSGPGGIGRVYLFDSTKAAGYRPLESRREEMLLFLDFLLSAGQRSGALRDLYQPARSGRSPISAVGIRSIEYDSDLLSRLATAHFGHRWLPLLLAPSQSADTRALDDAVRPFLPGELDQRIQELQLGTLVETEIAGIERQIQAMDTSTADWPIAVRTATNARVEAIEAEMRRDVERRLRAPLEAQLQDLPATLRDAVDRLLVRGPKGCSLGSARARAQHLLDQLALSQTTSTSAPAASEPDGLNDIHDRYLRFRALQVSPEEARVWWPMVTFTAAILAVPLMVETLRELATTSSGQSSFWSHVATMSGWLGAHPGLLLIVAGTAGWGLLGVPAHRALTARVERARAFFTHRDRGRLIDRVRRLLHGRTRQMLAAAADDARRRSFARVQRFAWQRLRHVVVLLERREQEIRWLQRKLEGFLRLHGVDPSSEPLRFASDRAVLTGPRVRLERDADLHRMSSVPNISDAVSQQIEWRTFESWHVDRLPVFLEPLQFVGDLHTKLNYRPSETADVVQRVLNAVARIELPEPAFRWLASDSLPVSARAAILPTAWQHSPALRQALEDRGFTTTRNNPADAPSGRLFLIHVRTDVPLALMGGANDDRA
jgi:hypothetical protein